MKNIKQILKYILIVVLVAAATLFIAKKCTHFFDTPIIQYQSKIIEKNIIDNTKFSTTNQSTRAVQKAIEKARKKPEKNLFVTLPIDASDKEIQKQVNKTKGQVALAEPSDTHSGINIYSIHINKHKNAIGLYMGANVEHCTRDTAAYGIHYRHDRVAYQIGKTFGGELDARVVWEAVQW